jgi:hypothetical protein
VIDKRFGTGEGGQQIADGPDSGGQAERSLWIMKAAASALSDKISKDTPLRLSVAAALAFPDGSMTTSGLRKEAARGRLAIERIAGKDYTTLAAIEEMRALCRVRQKGPVYGSGPKNESPMGPSGNAQCGSSETDRARSARAALHKIARARSVP